MNMPSLPFRLLCAVFFNIVLLFAAYPFAFVLTHGLVSEGWPAGELNPFQWLDHLRHFHIVTASSVLLDMIRGHATALPYGGLLAGWTMALVLVLVPFLVISRGLLVPARDASNRFGNARWASPKVLKGMRRGLELGCDPATGNAVRVLVEGNLVAIAPPRSGKTSGLILPALAFAGEGAWGGPTVVIDPKGDAYRAVKRRREALGRTVRCIDPIGLIGGEDRWNPLLHVDPADTLMLLSLAASLLPETAADGNANYFKDRASVLVAGAMLTTISDGRANAGAMANLVRDPEALARALSNRTEPLARDALAILNMEARSRDPLLGTARQSLQFLLDERLQAVMADHTVDFNDITEGNLDLFIVTPADARRDILAPYLRWLLSDLFGTVRRQRPVERIVVIIDEAFVLGRFDAVLKGVGELPGYGISLWTFWQSRAQMIETFGEAGAGVLLDTAEVTTLFNTSRVRPDEAEYWSRAIGSFTGVQVTTAPDANGRMVETRSAVEQRLVPATELNAITRRQSISFLSGAAHTPDPLLLDKTRPFTDPRFAGLLDPVEPVGRLRA